MAFSESLMALGFKPHARPTAGLSWFTPPVCAIPAGPFVMGSDRERDPLAFADEFPRHVVSLPAYEIGRYPVTVAEYACAVSAGVPAIPEPVNWAWQREFPMHPIAALTWYEAAAYARWLTEQTGDHWRLPSEAEWEKAARGNDGRIYPWGDTWDPEKANVWEQKTTADAQELGTLGETTAIDAYPLGASPYGVLDLVSNVAEWTTTVADLQRFTYPYRADDGRDDLAVDAPMRVTRGGCWLFPPERLRAAHRAPFHTTDRFDWLHGLRLVRDSTTP